MLSIPYTSYLSSLRSINVLALTLLLDFPTRIPPPLMLLYTQYYCLLTPLSLHISTIPSLLPYIYPRVLILKHFWFLLRRSLQNYPCHDTPPCYPVSILPTSIKHKHIHWHRHKYWCRLIFPPLTPSIVFTWWLYSTLLWFSIPYS